MALRLPRKHLADVNNYGLSSPVLGGNRVFLTAVENGRLVTLALNTATGKPLWRRQAPEVKLEKVHAASSPAASTPHVDTQRIYVYFGSYGLLCYDHAGKEQWTKPIPTPKSMYGAATSPIGYGDNVILVLDSDGKQIASSRSVAKTMTNETLSLDKRIKAEQISLVIKIEKAKVYSFSIE